MQRIILIAIFVIMYCSGAMVGLTDHAPFYAHLLFAFFHVNIFHLLCNAIALWAIRGSIHITQAFIINLTASYLPTLPMLYDSSLPTYGFSGVIFASIGISWGRYFYKQLSQPFICINLPAFHRNIKRFMLYTITPIIITIFIPNVNWYIHLYCLTLGMLSAVFPHALKKVFPHVLKKVFPHVFSLCNTHANRK